MTKRILLAFFLIFTFYGLQSCRLSNSEPQFIPKIRYQFPEPGMPPKEPLPWAHLELKGRLLLIEYTQNGNRLLEVNLESGMTKLLFQSPERSWFTAFDVSPDSAQAVLAYAPPPIEGQIQFGYTDLYLLPLDGVNQPHSLLTRVQEDESFFNPVWAPDGKHIYYAHLYRSDPNSPLYKYRIEKLSLEGNMEVVIHNALWPSLSPDGSKLAYLTYDLGISYYELFISDMVNDARRPVFQQGTFPTIDAHMFAPDGKEIYFIAANPETFSVSPGQAKLFSVGSASAHNVPSDWYRVSLDGGEPQRLTYINDIGLSGAFSSNGNHFAFIGQKGLFVMDPDGGNLTAMADIAATGSLNWIP